MSSKKIRTYSELMLLPTFKERYDYLRIGGEVGADTFGYERYLNQAFYRSKEWKQFRNKIIIRDNGCDLAMEGREINDRIYIHHMNPITIEDIEERSDFLMNPNYVICCSFNTHQAIHYGNDSMLFLELVERKPNDTIPWR